MPRNLFIETPDDLDEIGEPHAMGVGLDASSGAALISAVPPGMCFIVQRIVGQGNQFGTQSAAPDISPVLVSPGVVGEYHDGILFRDAVNTTQWTMEWRPFLRAASVFSALSPLIWRGSEPQSLINWKLRFPLCVPANWSMQSTQNGLIGNNFAVYGRLVSESAARQLGYTVSDSATDANRMCGVDSVTSTMTTTQIIVPARTDYSIQILDIHIRNQPVAALITNGTVTVEQGDGRAIFVLANNSPGELRELVFAPGLYLKPGESLNAKSSTALTGSVVVSWRYVKTADVPSDHWWACVEPGLPTPATTPVGLAEIGRATSHEVTCFYPRLNVTKTAPTTGFQHLLRGYTVSIQKDPVSAAADTDPSDYFFARISNGASAGQIGLSTAHGITDTGVALTPLFTGLSHDQCFACAVDQINLLGLQDTGSFWIDTLGFGPLTLATPAATVGIDEFWVTLWGKTIPSRFTNPSNRGTA